MYQAGDLCWKHVTNQLSIQWLQGSFHIFIDMHSANVWNGHCLSRLWQQNWYTYLESTFHQQWGTQKHRWTKPLEAFSLQLNSVLLIHLAIQHLLHASMVIYRLPNMALCGSAQQGAHLHMNLQGKLFSQHMLRVHTNCHRILRSDISTTIRWDASNRSSIKLFTHLSAASPAGLQNSPSHERVHRGTSQLILTQFSDSSLPVGRL